MLYKTVLNII